METNFPYQLCQNLQISKEKKKKKTFMSLFCVILSNSYHSLQSYNWYPKRRDFSL